MRTVQLSIADAGYAATLREALTRTGPWHVDMVDRPDPAIPCVLVLDESSFERLPLPLVNPERVVLISQHDPQLLARAWDARIVSVLSTDDSLPTVLLAIMAAALRIGKSQARSSSSVNSPKSAEASASITPENLSSRPRRCKSR
jgi:DNA-binding NarL/FixJ family response regulator